MVIDHICFAVKSIEEGILYWKKMFGYCQHTLPVVNTRQRVKVVFLAKPDSLMIKLIEPVEGNFTLAAFVNKGGGFHHICFKCSDLEKEIDNLQNKGMRLLVSPQPGEAFNNNLIAFLWSQNNLNIELIASDEKADVIK